MTSRIPSVVVNEEGVTRYLDDGSIESVRWEDLVQINVLTTSAGPFLEDVFFELAGGNGTGCLVPQGAEQFSQLLERFLKWPEFDGDQFARAMCCTDDARFVCWQRDRPPCSC
jgi:hypothetical protein